MKRYTIINLNKHVCFNSDKLMPCMDFIHNELDNSKLSWKYFFKENQMCIIDSEKMLVVWSTKSHII